MKEDRFYLEMDRYDKNILLNALNELRTKGLKEERPVDPINELIIRISEAPLKKHKALGSRSDEER